MKNLLIKEFKLAIHPTTFIFWLLSSMLLIPEYPYYIIFFYSSLGLFFVCLTGRENHDIDYSMSLPVRKRDIVKARFGFAVIVQTVQALIAVPFAIIRQSMPLPGNGVGMDANIAFFGLGMLLMGAFNMMFLTSYYAAPDKVGKSFAFSSIAMFVLIIILEAPTYFVPFFRDVLDTPDPMNLGAKLATLAVGLAGYALLTWLAYRISAKKFEALDL